MCLWEPLSSSKSLVCGLVVLTHGQTSGPHQTAIPRGACSPSAKPFEKALGNQRHLPAEGVVASRQLEAKATGGGECLRNRMSMRGQETGQNDILGEDELGTKLCGKYFDAWWFGFIFLLHLTCSLVLPYDKVLANRI